MCDEVVLANGDRQTHHGAWSIMRSAPAPAPFRPNHEGLSRPHGATSGCHARFLPQSSLKKHLRAMRARRRHARKYGLPPSELLSHPSAHRGQVRNREAGNASAMVGNDRQHLHKSPDVYNGARVRSAPANGGTVVPARVGESSSHAHTLIRPRSCAAPRNELLHSDANKRHGPQFRARGPDFRDEVPSQEGREATHRAAMAIYLPPRDGNE